MPACTTPEGLAGLIVPSGHGNSAGIVGALFLAHKALGSSEAAATPRAGATVSSAARNADSVPGSGARKGQLPKTEGSGCQVAAAPGFFRAHGAGFSVGVAAGLALAFFAKARACA